MSGYQAGSVIYGLDTVIQLHRIAHIVSPQAVRFIKLGDSD
jgi:hypothetical protein